MRRPRQCYSDCSMELVTGHIGWIEVVCGPMFSGKSEELIRRLRRARIARKRVQVFKPAIDDRYSVDEIVSHGDQRMKSDRWWTPRIFEQARLAHAGGRHRRIELFRPRSGRYRQSARRHRQAGDHRRPRHGLPRPSFTPMPELLCLAESITKTLAICMRCGNPAKHTQRLVESHDLIVVGAAGMNEARCRRCFNPAFPSRK